MIKRLSRIVTALTILLLSASCIKDPEFKPAEIGVSKTELNFGKEASQMTVSLLSNRDWETEVESLQGDTDWLKLSDTVGVASKDSVYITISVLKNTEEDRIATVKFNTGTVCASVRVSQKGEIEHHYTPIKEVRALYKGSDITIDKDMTVKGTVISNYRGKSDGGLNNSTSLKTMIISDDEAGISLYFQENNKIYAPGDVITVKLKGLVLQRFNNGSLQVNGVPFENVQLIENGREVEPISITAAQLCTGEYESRYVAVSDVQVDAGDRGKTFVTDKEKHSSIHFESKTGEKFVLFSSKYSTYGSEKVPEGSGTLKGIGMVFGSTYQLSITKVEDYAGLTGERFDGTGPVPPTPGNGKVIGDYNVWNAVSPVTSFYDDFSTVTEGNKEYINDNWMFYSVDPESVFTGWKTGVFNEDKYIQIAPFSSKMDKVVAYALMPRVNVSGANPKTYSFRKALYWKDNEDDSRLEVVVSKNFTGDFENATWTVVKNVSFPAGSEKNNWVEEVVDLSSYASESSLAVALRYTGKSNTYRIDDVKVGDAEVSDQFSISAATKTVSAAAGSFDIYVSGNVEWTVSSSDASNFSVSPASGKGNDKVTVSYTENKGEAREAVITFSTNADVSNKQLTCKVTQKAEGQSDGGALTSNVDITSNIAQGQNAYKYTVHTSQGDCEGLKIGTSKKAGSYTTPSLPETGDMEFSMHAVAWNGKKCQLTVTVNGGGTINGSSSASFDLRSEKGTYNTQEDATFDFTSEDYFTAKLSGITSSTTITFSSTVEGGTRAVIGGVNVKK